MSATLDDRRRRRSIGKRERERKSSAVFHVSSRIISPLYDVLHLARAICWPAKSIFRRQRNLKLCENEQGINLYTPISQDTNGGMKYLRDSVRDAAIWLLPVQEKWTRKLSKIRLLSYRSLNAIGHVKSTTLLILDLSLEKDRVSIFLPRDNHV